MISTREEIIARLSTLAPNKIEVIDTSHSHAGHAGAKQHQHRTGAAEGTHFDIYIVSPQFEGASPIARHRMIYALLDDLMQSQIHALKIDARPA